MPNTGEEKGFEVHDKKILMKARNILDQAKSVKEMADAVLGAALKNFTTTSITDGRIL